MNKLFGFLIVGLLLIIGVLLYSDYSSPFTNFLCEKANLCSRPIKDESTGITTRAGTGNDIITTVQEKQFSEIVFDPSNTGDIEIYHSLKAQGIECHEIEGFIMGGGSLPGCLQTTGYEHIYTINTMGIKVLAYNKTSLNSIDNPGLLYKQIDMPIMISGNKIYSKESKGISSSQYIEYHELQAGETRENVIQNAINLQYNGFVYDKESGVTTGEIQNDDQTKDTNRYSYILTYRKGDEYPLSIKYYFQDNKLYYYKVNQGPECIPGPCGLGKHDIQLFTK